MPTATEDNPLTVRFLESKEIPGQVCAQAFADPIKDNRFGRMQCSSWHQTKAEATDCLERRIRLEGMKVAE